ncbi:hypothetical protein WJX84_000242 [Apatococcus fuscideae]|uniref:Uncharacterized protein n=1 Tax=Apatococcus fuscideae TaxID=2026836 RepID=A0AAW1TAG0_9CHLO
MQVRRTPHLALASLLAMLLASSARSQATAPAPAPVSALEGPFVEEDIQLEPFTGVQICLPYNVLIAPSDGNYSISMEASLDVLAGLTAKVTDGTLQLETDADFVTDQPIKLTVFVPSDRLQSILVTSPLSQVTLAPGFHLTSFSINNGYNAANAILLGLKTRFLNVISSG